MQTKQTNIVTLETVYGASHSFRVTGTPQQIIAVARNERQRFAGHHSLSPYAIAVEVRRG